MTQRWIYRVAGLQVEVPQELPEWGVFATGPDGASDVTVELLPPGDSGTPAIERMGPGDHVFTLPGIGEFHVRNGNEIRVRPQPGTGAAELRLGLLGSAWGSLCYQRGLLLLHGSAVAVDGHLVAFAGPSGAGKSSLTAAAVRAGFDFWADDHLWVDLTRDEVHVHRGAPRLKLWRDTLHALDVPLTDLPRDHYRTDKYHAPPDALGRAGGSTHPPPSMPLGHILLLQWGEPGLVRLQGMNALRALLAQASYRPAWIPGLGRAPWYWDACADVVRRVPVAILTRAQDLAAMDAVVERVARHVGTATEACRHDT